MPKKLKGFTIVELLVVLVVVAIIVSLATVWLTQLRRQSGIAPVYASDPNHWP